MNEKTTKRKSLHLLNNLRNFNEIFRKDMTSDNIKIKKKIKKTAKIFGLCPLSRRYTFQKSMLGWVNLSPNPHPTPTSI